MSETVLALRIQWGTKADVPLMGRQAVTHSQTQMGSTAVTSMLRRGDLAQEPRLGTGGEAFLSERPVVEL